MAKISFYRGLKAKYNASTHADAIFFATDSHEIMLNDVAYGLSVEGLAALQSAIDANTQKLANIEAGAQVNKIESVKVDGSALSISDKSVNIEIASPIATAKNEAINAGKISIAEAAGTGEILKTYTFSQNGETIGTINIAKDLVVTAGQVIEKNGVKYLQLSIANQEAPVEIAVTDLVDVYSGSTYITVNADNSIEVKFADLATALAAEGNAVGNKMKANADAIAAEQLRAEGIEGGLRADLGNNTDAAASEGSAFARIAQLKADISSLTGGSGSVASQIESAINTLKGDMTSASIGVLEDKVEANEAAINLINETIEGLDVTESTGDYVKTISQTNGRISVTTGAFNFDEKGAAAAAESAAKAYADGLASNYDAAGSAAQALIDAKAYTDESLIWHEAA